MLKTNVLWPASRRFKSRTEWEPIGFFSEALCNSTQFDIKLGFFSSSAINILSDGFATFLYNGGQMRMVINDVLSVEDQQAFMVGETDVMIPYFDLQNIQEIKRTLSERDKHFFECLSWLVRNERLEIKIVAPKCGDGIAHSKCGVFTDGLNRVAFEGSCNFSRTALIDNLESITAFCDWDGQGDICKIDDIAEDFERTFSGNDDSVLYLKADEVKAGIATNFEQKDLASLLKDEQNLISRRLVDNLPINVQAVLNKAKRKVESIIDRIEIQSVHDNKTEIPHFPFDEPRAYQKQAYENWKNNGQKGLFAMATGTGKTLTSLNCLLNIYQKFHFYKALILVPTITLVDQWEEECERFHFRHIIKVSSKNPNWKSEIDAIKLKEDFSISNEEPSFIIIATYASFAREPIFQELVGFSKKTCRQMLLIADEAHNMGSGRILDRLSGVKFLRRIGLSATPERQFDDVGNRAIMDFFGCQNGYTFEYSMQEAIDNGFLCRYKYYPHLVRLNDSEMNEYLRISLQLAKFYNSDSDSFPMSDDILKRLLLKRKRIVHKAKNKEEIFREIVMNRYSEKGNLKYTLVYVPEGAKPDDNTSDMFDMSETVVNDDYTDSLIDTYTQIVQEVSKTTTVKKFTSDVKGRSEILDKYAKGEIEVLTSMKCLDEGVDVPRSEMAIFCASTGNPRQFIQRRGRILRKHPDKHMAIIHDLVVAPEISRGQENYNMERSLLKGELKRVRDFAVLSENADFAYAELEEILTYYNLPLF
jgi:superfamily II DNA or RNA helicase